MSLARLTPVKTTSGSLSSPRDLRDKRWLSTTVEMEDRRGCRGEDREDIVASPAGDKRGGRHR